MRGADPKTVDGSGPEASAEAVLPVSSKHVTNIFRRLRWIPPEKRIIGIKYRGDSPAAFANAPDPSRHVTRNLLLL